MFVSLSLDKNDFSNYVLGFFCGAALFIIPFIFGFAGGADVKAFAVVGSYIGVQLTISAFVYSLIFGMFLALYHLFVDSSQLNHFAPHNHDSTGHQHHMSNEHDKNDKKYAIAFIPCILAGVILTYYYPLEWTI